MDEKTKKFLQEQLITGHVQNLLELYGIAYVQDLVSFDQTDIEEIEKNVREGGFNGQVDFQSKSNRVKYLGFDMADIKHFSFRIIDKKKLKTLSLAASQKLKAADLKKSRSSLDM